MAAYTEVHRILHEEVPSIPLYQAAAIYAAKDGLRARAKITSHFQAFRRPPSKA